VFLLYACLLSRPLLVSRITCLTPHFCVGGIVWPLNCSLLCYVINSEQWRVLRTWKRTAQLQNCCQCVSLDIYVHASAQQQQKQRTCFTVAIYSGNVRRGILLQTTPVYVTWRPSLLDILLARDIQWSKATFLSVFHLSEHHLTKTQIMYYCKFCPGF